jgi:hypothetical protein
MPATSAVALSGYALNVALPAVILANVPLLNISSALLIPSLKMEQIEAALTLRLPEGAVTLNPGRDQCPCTAGW